MNVQVARLPQGQVSLDIAVDSAAVGNAIDRAYQRLSQRVNVPGFRKGKAPRAVLEAAIGRSAVLEEAADLAVNDAYRQALEQTGLVPITNPEIQLQGSGLDPSQPLYFTAKFYVQPEVQLGDYQSIRVEPPKGVVDDEAVERVITRMAEVQAPWEAVEDRPAEPGDVAEVKLQATVDGETVVDEETTFLLKAPDSDGDAEEGATLEAQPDDIRPHLIGMRVEETRDFDLPLPDDFEPAQYAGQTARYHVELLRLERRAAPVLDDAFAQSVGNGEFASLDDLRARVRTSLEVQQRADDADQFVAEVMRRAVDGASAEIPPPLVEDEIHHTLDNFQAELERRERLTLDLYLRLSGKTMEQLHEEVREPSEQRVKSNLVLEAIAAAEDLTPPRAEVDAELRELAALPTVRERDRRRVLTSPTVRARVEARLKRRLALQRLLQIANPNPTDDSADTTTGDGSVDQQVLQQAAESHADALETPTHQPSEQGERG